MAQTVPCGSAHGISITRQDPLSWTARATAWITATKMTWSGSFHTTLVVRVTLGRFEWREVERGNPIPPANFTHQKRNKTSHISIPRLDCIQAITYDALFDVVTIFLVDFWWFFMTQDFLEILLQNVGAWPLPLCHSKYLWNNKLQWIQYTALTSQILELSNHPRIFKPSYCMRDDEQGGRKTLASSDSMMLWIKGANWNQANWMRVPWNNEFKHEQRNNVLISPCNHGNIGRFENNKREWQFYKRFNMNRFSFHCVYK